MLTETLRLHLAVRAGDCRALAALLDERPTLVEAREDWDGSWLRAGIAPHSQHGTPLGRAVALGRREVVELLLERGAHIEGGCGCVTRESPLWTAVANGRDEITAMLLARGASPQTASNMGTTPLHIAAMRGDVACVELLLAAGASPNARDCGGRTPLDWARERGHAATIERLGGSAASPTSSAAPQFGPSEILESGIRAFDLFCPLGRGRVLRQQARVGYGHLALLGELSHRWMGRPNTLIAWCGFEPRPYSREDFAAELREFGLGDQIELPLMAPEDSPSESAAKLATQVSELRKHAEDSGTDVIVIAIEELGHAAAIEAVLDQFGLTGTGSLSGIVSSPFRDDPEGAHVEAGPRYSGQVAFDLDRARRGFWPALSARSRSIDEGPLAARAREILNRGGDGAARIHEWMCQRFYVQELTWATPGQWTPWHQAKTELEEILASHDDA